MINLSLTNDEWFVLYTHVDNILKKYPDSKYLNSIATKLADNCPNIIDELNKTGCNSFRTEYTSQRTGEENER
jgi:succinate dehydrogenase/fumarate reductase flavoprotein subunit